MARTCFQCHEWIADDARFCTFCGADQSLPQPVDQADLYCTNCGAAIPERNQFCTQCGAPVHEESDIPPAAVAAPPPPPPVYTAPPPAFVPPSPRQPAPPPGPRSTKKYWFIGLAGFLALLIAIYAILQSAWFDRLRNGQNGTSAGTTTASGWEQGKTAAIDIVFTDQDYTAAEPVTATVSPGQTAVELTVTTPPGQTGGSGATGRTSLVAVDFGTANISADSTLSVRALAPRTDRRLGLTAQLYDFSLSAAGSQISEFATTVQITLPCPAEADEIAYLQYYQAEDQAWQLIPCTRDNSAGTISCQISHFSGIAVFTADGSTLHQIPGSIFSYVGDYQGPTTPVMVTDTDMDRYLATISTDQLARLLRFAKIPADDEIAAALALANNISSGVDVVVDTDMAATKLSKILSGETMARVNPVLTKFGAALVMGRICYQLNKGVNPATVVKDNAFNIVESAFGLAALYTGAAPLAFAATAVFVSGVIYDQIKEPLAPSAWNEYTYYYYNRNGVLFNTDTLEVGAEYYARPNELLLDAGGPNTARAIDAIYKQHGKDPQALNQALAAFINAYVGRFWQDPNIRHDVYYQSMLLSLGAANTMTAPEKYDPPTDAEIKAWQANFRRELLGALQPVFKAYMQRTFNDLKQALLDDITKNMLPLLNTIVTFEIVDPTPGIKTFDQSVYAKYPDYTIMFGDPVFTGFNPGGLDYSKPEDHIFRAQKNSNQVYACSLYAYMAQGMPDTIDLIPQATRQEIITVPFKLSLPVTVITLEARPADESSATTRQARGVWQLQATRHSDLQKMIDYNALSNQITVSGSEQSLTITNKELHYQKSVTVRHRFTAPPAVLVPDETATVDVAAELLASDKLFDYFQAGTVLLMDLKTASDTSYGWGGYGESGGAWIRYSYSGGAWSGYDHGELTAGLTSSLNTLTIKAPPAPAATDGYDTFVITLRATQNEIFSYDTYYIYQFVPQ